MTTSLCHMLTVDGVPDSRRDVGALFPFRSIGRRMETVADVLEAGHDRAGDAFDAAGRATGYSYREFCTSAWKAGNLLRHYGVRSGSRVAVVVGPKTPEVGDEPGVLRASPDPLFAALGATLLGGMAVLDPAPPIDGDALVAPAAWLDRYEVGPGCARIAYGGPPEDADVVHFEQATWSQNPVAPPEAAGVVAETVAVREGADGREDTHDDLLAGAREFVAATDLRGDSRVCVRARLDAEAFATGVLAPLVAGATIVGGPDGDCDVVVD